MKKQYRLDYDAVTKAVKDILNILGNNPMGAVDQKAKASIKSHLKVIKKATTDSYIEEKVVSIGSWTDIGYSTKKHLQWNNDYIGDARLIESFIRSDCAAIKEHAAYVSSRLLRSRYPKESLIKSCITHGRS